MSARTIKRPEPKSNRCFAASSLTFNSYSECQRLGLGAKYVPHVRPADMSRAERRLRNDLNRQDEDLSSKQNDGDLRGSDVQRDWDEDAEDSRTGAMGRRCVVHEDLSMPTKTSQAPYLIIFCWLLLGGRETMCHYGYNCMDLSTG